MELAKGLKTVFSKLKKITKIKNKKTLLPQFFDNAGQETNNFFIWHKIYSKYHACGCRRVAVRAPGFYLVSEVGYRQVVDIWISIFKREREERDVNRGDSSSELFQYFENLIGKVDTENTEHIILGDFNCNFVPDRCDDNCNKYRNIADIYLTQLIDFPTRVTLKSSSLTDLIFTNCPNKAVCSRVAHIDISDHSFIYVYRKLSIPSDLKGDNVSIRYFNKFNSVIFFAKILWRNLGMRLGKWKIGMIFVRTRRIRKSKIPWISSHLKDLMHHKDRLKIKAIKSKDFRDWLNFKKTRTHVKTAIRNAKKFYYNTTFDKYSNIPRKTWQTK